MSIGFSIYLGTDDDKNDAIIQKAVAAKMTYAFTSLHIPEEKVTNYQKAIKNLLEKCRKNNIKLIADVSPHTLEKLACADYEDLLAMGFEYLRPDFGYSDSDIVALSQMFHLVLNASTTTISQMKAWEDLGADLTRFTACHNFYPKPLTGLSLKKVNDMNQMFKRFGMMTMTFVAGDCVFREPLFLGLPTVEDQRNHHVFKNILELMKDAASDVVLIGDVDVTDGVYRRIKDYHEGFITLQCHILDSHQNLLYNLHHDRPDASEYVIRSQESRFFHHKDQNILKGDTLARQKGAICISNELYLRYEGELEIAKIDLPKDERVNVIGQVIEEDLIYLQYITDGMGFKLI